MFTREVDTLGIAYHSPALQPLTMELRKGRPPRPSTLKPCSAGIPSIIELLGCLHALSLVASHLPKVCASCLRDAIPAAAPPPKAWSATGWAHLSFQM